MRGPGQADHGDTRRRPGERAGLAAEAVLAEARALYQREGIERLTMRRLAHHLGVAPNALYSHFAGKSALVDALTDALLAGIEVPESGHRDWRRGLSDLMRATRRFLLAHADLIPHLLSRPQRGPNAIRLGEETLTFVEHAGLGGEDAVEALRILLIYTFGFAAQEAPRRADPRPERRRFESEAAFRAAPERPLTRELAPSLSEHPSDATFERGLAWLLDGIQAATERGTTDTRRSDGPPRGTPSADG